jgi:hypothetical protein
VLAALDQYLRAFGYMSRQDLLEDLSGLRVQQPAIWPFEELQAARQHIETY